jgi:hypothetical protein
MCTEFELKMAVQALSHIWPTERREPDASFGNACNLVVAALRCGRGRYVVAVDVSGCHDVAIGDNDVDGQVGIRYRTMVQLISHLVEVGCWAAVCFEVHEWRGGH